MGILDAPTSAAAARVIGAKRATSIRVVVIGDSITFNNNGGHFQELCVRANGRAINGGWFATQGYTTQNILDTHIPSVLALTGSQKPAACVILAGTNDVGANAGVGFSLSAVTAVHKQITDRLTAAGILPILCTIPPRGDLTVPNQNAHKLNAYLRMSAAQNGWPLLEYNTQLVDPAGTGGWKTGLTGDGIHPNLTGSYRKMTENLVASFVSMLPPGSVPISNVYADTANLLGTSGQTFRTNAGSGVATGWNNYGGAGCVYTLESDSAISGNWQTLTRPAGASGNAYLQSANITTGFAVGDRLSIAALVKVLNLEANNPTTNGQSVSMILNFRNGSTILSDARAMYAWTSDIASGMAYAEGIVPATCNSIDIGIQLSGTPTAATNGATVKVAQPTITNLTALGLA